MSHGATGSERGSWRGTGAELRTDAWAVVRAGGGLLLSTTARPQAAGTVLDAHEARGQLTAAQKTAQRLSDAASSQQALPLAANEAFDPISKALDPVQDGHYESTVNGQEATQPNQAPVDRFDQPLLVAESPTSIALASQATTTVYAGRHLHGTAQVDWHLAAGNVVAAAAAKGVSLFAQRNGIRAIAEGGPVSIQAHTDALAVLADKAVTVTSSADSIEILAQQSVVLHGGDSLIRLDGNAITFETSGTLSVKGAGHPLIGPGGQAAELPALPQPTTQTHWLELNYRDLYALPMVGAPYTIRFADGTTRKGNLDAQGHAKLDGVPPGPYTVAYGEAQPPAEPRFPETPNPFFSTGLPNSSADATKRLQAFMEQDDAYLKDNYFPDEIAEMQSTSNAGEGTTSLLTESHLSDYLVTSETGERKAQSGYRGDHPEGQEVQS